MSRRLIVGLGNPGPEYAQTRHNVGFMVVDALAERTRVTVSSRRDDAVSGWGRWRGRELGLSKPDTYMNRSGTAVQALSKRYRLLPADLLVIVDDLNLPLGRIRIRENGGAGGHNGLQDIIDWLDTDAFPRLRIGVGSEFRQGSQVDYVLSPFDDEERPVIDEAVDSAVQAALTYVTDGIRTAMNRFNR